MEQIQRDKLIYFDHAAATPVLREVFDALPEFWTRSYANSEAAHALGYEARKDLEAMELRLFRTVFPWMRKLKPAVFWGSSASELIYLLGEVAGRSTRSAVGSALDHPAAQAMLGKNFREVLSLPLDRWGRITDIPECRAERPPLLAYFTWVQSEIGVMQDLAWLERFRTRYPDTLIVLDAVQGVCKFAYTESSVLPDVMILSGRKLGAPNGAALLFPTQRGRQLYGKFQNLRHPAYQVGRPDPATAFAVTLAAGVVSEHQAQSLTAVRELNRLLREKIGSIALPNGQKAYATIPEEFASPYIFHCMVPGYQSGVLVRMLSDKQIMLSAGSACQAETKKPSAVLTALGMSNGLAYSGLRLSFAPWNTIPDGWIFLVTLERLLKNY